MARKASHLSPCEWIHGSAIPPGIREERFS